MKQKERKQVLINFLRERKALIPFMLFMFDQDHTLDSISKYPWVLYSINPPPPSQYWKDLMRDYITFTIRRKPTPPQLPTPSVPNRVPLVQVFIDFLKEHNALIPYCCNIANGKTNHHHFNKMGRMKLSKSLSELTRSHTPDQWINEFIWSETSEKHSYWYKLNLEWKQIWKEGITRHTYRTKLNGKRQQTWNLR